MKLSSSNGKTTVKISLSEWKRIGIEKGWLTAQTVPNPNAAPGQPRPKRFADEITDFSGNLSEDITSYVDEVWENYTITENDGIGSYEFWGQKSFDKGTDYRVFEGFTLAVDVTGSNYDEFHNPESAEELPYVTGMISTQDGSYIDWMAHGVLRQHNQKVFALYSVKEQ